MTIIYNCTGENLDFDHTTGDGQKRMMAVSMGLDSEVYISKPTDLRARGDYGSDPIGNGLYRMVPSGDIVDFAELLRRKGTSDFQSDF